MGGSGRRGGGEVRGRPEIDDFRVQNLYFWPFLIKKDAFWAPRRACNPQICKFLSENGHFWGSLWPQKNVAKNSPIFFLGKQAQREGLGGGLIAGNWPWNQAFA